MIFLDFFYHLRSRKIKVSTGEYLDLLKVLNHYQKQNEVITPTRFYYIARQCLVKKIEQFDDYDLSFAEVFHQHIEQGHFKSMLQDWLQNAKKFHLDEKRRQQAMKIPPQDLLKELEKRLKEQKKRHDGGNHWIGTGGTSAFGHSGYNPQGIRIAGESQNKQALVVAGERKFESYRSDKTLDIRQMKVALKGLRKLSAHGALEVDIDQSIEKTCQNGGEISIVEKRARKNEMKVVLLMDVGGSMTEHSQRAEELFSALHQMNHFKEFHSFYFHNIFYDHFYSKTYLHPDFELSIDQFFKRFDSRTRIIIVGDAYMAPYELFEMNGYIRNYYDYFGAHHYQYPMEKSLLAIDRVTQLSTIYPYCVWLNPKQVASWSAPTIAAIEKRVKMYHLGVSGLLKAVDFLKSSH